MSLTFALVIGLAVAGVGGLLIVLVWFALKGPRTWLPWIAGGAFAVAALWGAGTQEVLPTTSAGTLGSPPNLLALLAVLAVAATFVPGRRSHAQTPEPETTDTEVRVP